MKWRVRGAASLTLLALGAGLVGVSAGCGGGSLTDRQSRLAGVYEGAGTLAGASASLSVHVASDGVASATLTASGASVALAGRVTSAGVLSLLGTGASAQGTLSESGGTVSVLLGAARASFALARAATPVPTASPAPSPTPTPTPTPGPTPEPGPSVLSASLFPLHAGDTWRWSVSGGGEASQTEVVRAEVLRDGRSVFPVERLDSTGRVVRRDYVPSGQTGGTGVIEQEIVLSTDGSTLSRTTLGQPLLVSYALARGQAGFANTLGGSRSSAAYLGSVTIVFTASFPRSERVSAPAGTFDCAVVRTVQETSYAQGGVFQSEASDVAEWRTEGVGPIKRTEGAVTWTLESATVGGRNYP